MVARSKCDALYRIERKMDELQLDADQRFECWQQYAVPKLIELKMWLEKNESKLAKDTLTHTAIKYALTQWGNLIAYCEHG
ncbi:MAG: transposase [Granulosicoccus sp.]|jgi:hypothetical protein